jgi:hypothetical protein
MAMAQKVVGKRADPIKVPPDPIRDIRVIRDDHERQDDRSRFPTGVTDNVQDQTAGSDSIAWRGRRDACR